MNMNVNIQFGNINLKRKLKFLKSENTSSHAYFLVEQNFGLIILRGSCVGSRKYRSVIDVGLSRSASRLTNLDRGKKIKCEFSKWKFK